jgi:hypothetical protein
MRGLIEVMVYTFAKNPISSSTFSCSRCEMLKGTAEVIRVPSLIRTKRGNDSPRLMVRIVSSPTVELASSYASSLRTMYMGRQPLRLRQTLAFRDLDNLPPAKLWSLSALH